MRRHLRQLVSSIQGKVTDFKSIAVTVDSLKAFPFFGIGGSLLSSLKSELPTYLAAADSILILDMVGPISGIIAKLEQKIVLCQPSSASVVLKRHFMNSQQSSLQDYVEVRI